MGAYLWVIELIMDFTKKIPSLVSLIAPIVFNDSMEWKKFAFTGLVSEIWEVGRVLVQPQWKLGQASVIYVILNKVTILLALYLMTHFKVYQICLLS